MYVIIAFVVGACIGSLLNMVIDRLPLGRLAIRLASNDEARAQCISASDLPPILSPPIPQGGSRYCRARIAPRGILVQMVTGGACLLTYLKYGFTPQWGVLVFYFSLFLTVAVIDLEHGLILNKLVYPSCPLALLLASLYPLGLATGMSPPWSFLNSLLGGGAAFGILLLPVLIWKEGMGWGDVKLGGLIGLATGFPGGVLAIVLAILGAGIVAGVLLISRLKKRRDHIPFGPFLAVGAMAALLWGKTIAEWYLGFTP